MMKPLLEIVDATFLQPPFRVQHPAPVSFSFSHYERLRKPRGSEENIHHVHFENDQKHHPQLSSLKPDAVHQCMITSF